jgi:hypothetical protein
MRHFACLLAIWPHTLILSPNKKFQSGRKLASFLKKNTSASSEPLPSARAVATRWLPASSVEKSTSLLCLLAESIISSTTPNRGGSRDDGYGSGNTGAGSGIMSTLCGGCVSVRGTERGAPALARCGPLPQPRFLALTEQCPYVHESP